MNKKTNKISLKKANFSDIEFLWYLRNQPDVYQYFRTPKPVAGPDHVNWIIPVLMRHTNKKLFVIIYSGMRAGQVRFDFLDNNSQADIGISVLKEFRGRAVATNALRQGIVKMKKEEIKLLKAEIHQDNIASQKLFEKLNFQFKDKKGIWLNYTLNL